MKAKESNDKIVIELDGKPTSSYSIISITLFVLCLLLIVFFVYKWYESPIFAMGMCFLPLVIIVFLFKILIWNFTGKETLVFGQNDLRVFYDYKIIYNKVIKNFNFKTCTILVITNNSEEPKPISSIEGKEKGVFKLKFLFDNEASYTSAMSVNIEEVLRLKKLIS